MTETRNPLDRLKAGVRQYQNEVHAPAAEAYTYAATHPQKPHTLFVTCSDSRISVGRITASKPGEVFVARNVGNLVPPYSRPLSDIAAVIEYAVAALKVSHVVVCGHADCGAMKAVLTPAATEKLPAVRAWLEQNAETAAQGTGSDALRSLTESNVRQQLVNLKTHPAVIDAMQEGRLTVSGWVYEIGSGEVRIAEDGVGAFVPVGGDAVKGTR